MKHIFPIFGLLFLLSSCIKNNPDPVWIEINEWTLEANPTAQQSAGELTSDISNAWVYVNNDFIGIFELPCKIPVLYSGESNIRIYPAIIDNGISATKAIYPFLELYEINENLVQNETLTINPTTRYLSNVQFWIEDFENAGTKIEDDPTAVASIQTVLTSSVTHAQPFNGNAFGQITLDETNNVWVGLSTGGGDVLNIAVGADAYLEIDYHNTNRITTGLLAVAPSGTTDNPLIQLNPQEEGSVEWKKIYIKLKEIIGNSASGSYFQLSFQSLLDEEDTSGEINIDNVKVVYF